MKDWIKNLFSRMYEDLQEKKDVRNNYRICKLASRTRINSVTARMLINQISPKIWQVYFEDAGKKWIAEEE